MNLNLEVNQLLIQQLLAHNAEKNKGDIRKHIAIVMVSANARESLADEKLFADLGYVRKSSDNCIQAIEEGKKCLFAVNAARAAVLKTIFKEKLLVAYVKVGLAKLRTEFQDTRGDVEFALLGQLDFASKYIDITIDTRYYDTKAVLEQIKKAAGCIGNFRLRKPLVKNPFSNKLVEVK